MKMAVVGATGMVGTVMLQVLAESELFTDWELLPVASERSAGQKVVYRGRELTLMRASDAIAARPSIAVFSAGGAASAELAPLFAQAGTTVIDNSSHWRMHPHIPLVVPEINASVLSAADRIIANPNCSTIQMVLALWPLHRRYGINRVVVSSYQSVTGTGVKALRQLMGERAGENPDKAYPWPIDMNVIPHGGSFLADGYTTEEEKLVNETRKILSDPEIRVTATVVRVPVRGGHSEAVNVELTEEFDLMEVKQMFAATPGVTVVDDPRANLYPMPLFAEGKNDVFVGRIRRDHSQPRTLNLWVVSDNLRKGAATNAIQIAEYLVNNHLISNNR
ncbi:MAG: aspartate-semialdehyde dehydrogenase [Bacteroidales bacterium]|nr:aspartate-semialdehyde dehydrogenase [Bacteroidales bacterium]